MGGEGRDAKMDCLGGHSFGWELKFSVISVVGEPKISVSKKFLDPIFKKIPNEKHSLTLRIFPHYFYNLITLASL